MIRITDIALSFDHTDKELKQAVLKKLAIEADELDSFNIVRRAIDARRKNKILAVYTIDAQVKDQAEVLRKLSDNRISAATSKEYKMAAVSGSRSVPVIVGTGPCGLFAALILAQMDLKPVVIERGKKVCERIKDVHTFWQKGTLNTESNVQFGEGGAGTFSDGKLTTGTKDKFNRSRKVLEELTAAGAPEEILYQAKPHIGTDNLIKVVKNLRSAIVSLGGDIRFETKLTEIKIKDGKVAGAVVNNGEVIETDSIVLALGHSAQDTFEMLYELDVPMEPKPFSIGVRIEHHQSVIDKVQYGKFAGHNLLGPAEYKLVEHCPSGRSAYTFCMCPGGKVIASSSQAETIVTNGMSSYLRSGSNANSGLLVGVGPEDFGGAGPLAGMQFQRKWEKKAFEIAGGNYFAPAQLVGDFLAGRTSKSFGDIQPSYIPGVTLASIEECLPEFVIETLRTALGQMDKKLKGFAAKDAVMTAIESRSSCPVRILRNDSFQSPAIKGLYPGGEGAGCAGGIISAAVDGIKIAEAIAAGANT